MSISDQQRRENQNYHLGDRDPRRPPGLALVVIAFILLCGLAYALFPDSRSTEPSPNASGGGPSANTNAAQSPIGK